MGIFTLKAAAILLPFYFLFNLSDTIIFIIFRPDNYFNIMTDAMIYPDGITHKRIINYNINKSFQSSSSAFTPRFLSDFSRKHERKKLRI